MGELDVAPCLVAFLLALALPEAVRGPVGLVRLRLEVACDRLALAGLGSLLNEEVSSWGLWDAAGATKPWLT